MSTNLSPIAAAVFPMKDEAVRRSVERMQSHIDALKAELIAADWNISAIAPSPRGTDSRPDYLRKQARLALVRSITIAIPRRLFSDPLMASGFDPIGIERVLADARDYAAAEFDAYVGKLEAKVGACESADVDGALWQHSILTVRKGDVTETWKTQQIVNVSSLGKLFNQWPTRRVA